MYVTDFTELREEILSMVGGRPLFSASKTVGKDLGQRMLAEPKDIKELLAKKP
jgi:hypothetical protein